MKNYFHSVIFIMLIAIVNISVSSCSKDDYSSPIKGKTVADLTFESSQSSNSITIGDADFTNFTIKSSETWCVASAQGKSLNITVQPNTTYGERQATITVTDPGDQSVVSFKVLQKQNDAILIDGSTFNVPETGGDVTIKVQSNVKYQIEIPSSASWLTNKAATRALENSTISLSAAANNSGDEREAIIKLTNTASGVSSQFTVKQGLTPAVSIDVDEIQMDEFGGEVEVSVTSNVAIDVKFSDDWISSAGTTAKGDFGFVQKIKVSALPSSENSRTAKVTFIDKLGKWNISKVVTVKQIKSLDIKDGDQEIYVGESYSLNLTNNVGGEISWKSSNTSVATVDKDGKVTGISKGMATISASTSDGKYTDEIVITVVDISSKLSCSWSVSSIQVGGWKQQSIGCTVKNGSKYSIVLTKCSIYKDGKLLNSTTDASLLGEVKAGESKGISINNVVNATSLYFLWEYTFNGKAYTYKCDAPSNVIN